MADPRRRHPDNAAGAWFVDDSCIDCDASRQCAPDLFGIRDGQSVVVRQPKTADELLRATRALAACPTGSIGGEPVDLDRAFPERIRDGVWYLGFNSRDSFGANAYYARGAAGGLLIDSPRFVRRLASAIEELGGIDHVLLTHRDDVADAQRFAEHFGARVYIHHADRSAAPFATDVISATSAQQLLPGVRVIPLPGHTRGSVAYLLDDHSLFTGDSLHHSRHNGRLGAFRDACWYSWSAQTQSLTALLEERFEWILPGHGQRRHDTTERLHAELRELTARMAADEEDGDW